MEGSIAEPLSDLIQDRNFLATLKSLQSASQIDTFLGALEQCKSFRLLTPIKFLYDRDPWLREISLRIIGSIGPQRCLFYPDISSLFDDEFPEVQLWSCWVAARWGTNSAIHLQKILKLTLHPNDGVKHNAIYALGQIKIFNESVLNRLLEISQESELDPSWGNKDMVREILTDNVYPCPEVTFNTIKTRLGYSYLLEWDEIGVLTDIFSMQINCMCRRALPDLLALIKDTALAEYFNDNQEDVYIEDFIIPCLIRIGLPAIPNMVNFLGSDDELINERALKYFHQLRETTYFIPLVKCLINNANSPYIDKLIDAVSVGGVIQTKYDSRGARAEMLPYIYDPDINVRGETVPQSV